MNKLVVISAPSGAGKTTLCQKLLVDFPELRLSISSTTRAPRGTEVHGKEYFFLPRPEFEKKIQAGEFAEWAEVHGNYYGTDQAFIRESFSLGKSILLDIDVQGAKSLSLLHPEDCLLIFIEPPSVAELERRLRSRGTESEENIQKRLKNARTEMLAAPDFHHRVVNDSFDHAYLQLFTIVAQAIRGVKHA
jgi:guanylate kinase